MILNRLRSRLALGVVAAALFALAGYLLASSNLTGSGFPLDDAWIHQTYARNLALRGEWAFLPGVPSAGSTSPLWTLLLVPGYWLGISPLNWAYVLGGLSLVGLALFGEHCARLLTKASPVVPWMGIFLASEWHLVWAAASGMETILYAALIMLVFWLLARKTPNWLVMGLLVGLAVWVRPDALTLVGPVVWVAVFNRGTRRERLLRILKVLTGVAVPAGLYLVFNYVLSGNIWPNTFFAKQIEYSIMTQTSLLERIGALVVLPMIGAGCLLLPGVIWAFVQGIREKQAWLVAAGLWWLGFTLVYAVRLPVTYQHGRYLIPAMPIFYILGVIGSVKLLALIKKQQRFSRLARIGFIAAMIGIQGAFYALGVSAYSTDVAIIKTEMVDTAQWVAENTPADALIAAHDIGAMGYFSQRTIIDLAGLISPDVIPFIRDEDKLAAYLDQENVQYLVTFPGWYTKLTQNRTVVYQSTGQYSPEAGGENMAVFRWPKP